MTMHLLTTTLETPAGPFTLLVGDEGVCAAGFSRHAETLQRRLGMPYRAAPARPASDLGEVSTAVRAYLGGELDALDDMPVTLPGDPSEQAAWRALRAVPAGRTINYRSSRSARDWSATRAPRSRPARPAPATTRLCSYPATASCAPTAASAATCGGPSASSGSSPTNPHC